MTKAVAVSAPSAKKICVVDKNYLLNGLSPQRERDFSIDAFRFVSLLSIFLAHCTLDPNKHLFLFHFVKCNTVLVNAGCALGSRQSRTRRLYWPYMWGKIKGTVISSYAYLLFVYVVNVFYPMPFCTPTFFLEHGRLFGCLWIMRGYLLIYALSPFINEYCRREKSHVRYFITVGLVSALLSVAYFFVLELVSSLPLLNSFVASNIGIIYLFPMMYACFFRVPDLSYTQFWRLFTTMMGITISIMLVLKWTEKSTHPSDYRNPNSIFFGMYGLCAAMISYRLTPLYEYVFSVLGMKTIVSFTSSHSMWVYLHHITFFYMPIYEVSLLYRWFILSASSIFLAYIQSQIVKEVASRVRPSVATNLRLIFG